MELEATLLLRPLSPPRRDSCLRHLKVALPYPLCAPVRLSNTHGLLTRLPGSRPREGGRWRVWDLLAPRPRGGGPVSLGPGAAAGGGAAGDLAFLPRTWDRTALHSSHHTGF